MKKTAAVLWLYDEFGQGRSIGIGECCCELGISVPTFRRYIALLRAYFMEKHGRDIVYDTLKKAYVLS